MAQIFVHGESLKACLLGVVVLDPDTVHKWVKEELNITGATMKELCANKVKQYFTTIPYKYHSKFSLLLAFFSLQNADVTPT